MNIDKLSKIPKHMNIGIGKIIEEHHIDKNIKENPNLETSWRNISKGKVKTCFKDNTKTYRCFFLYLFKTQY